MRKCYKNLRFFIHFHFQYFRDFTPFWSKIGSKGPRFGARKGAKTDQKYDQKTDAVFERQKGPRVVKSRPSRGSGEGVGGGVNPSPKGIWGVEVFFYRSGGICPIQHSDDAPMTDTQPTNICESQGIIGKLYDA